MQLRDIMTRDPVVIGLDTTLMEAAGKMHEIDSGLLPVGENDRLVGMLTDRDITVRATAAGKNPSATKVREVMTQDVVYCFEDDDVRDARARWSSIRSAA